MTVARCAALSSASSTRWCCGLRANTAYSAPFVTTDVAAEMTGLITEHAETLRATAAWFG